MPSNVFTIALRTRKRPDPTDPILVLFPDRVEGPDDTPLRKGLGLIASLLRSDGYSGKLVINDTYLHHVYAHPWLFPRGSFVMITQEGWEGEVDAVISPKHGKFGLCTPLGTWENLDDFSAPDGTSSNFCQTHTQWVDPLWDSVAFGVLLGAIDARLPMAFDTAPGKAQISSLWMYAVAASANRTLHPWLGDTSIPTRGHGSRPFPLTSNAKRATEEGTYALLGYPKGTDGYRSFKTPFVNALFTIGALAPNAPYAATAWVKGPHWERTLARFPHAIIEAGRAIGPTIPTDACGLTEAEIVAGKPAAQGLTRHQHLAFTAMMRQPDATLKRLLPTYARGRKPSTKRQAA